MNIFCYVAHFSGSKIFCSLGELKSRKECFWNFLTFSTTNMAVPFIMEPKIVHSTAAIKPIFETATGMTISQLSKPFSLPYFIISATLSLHILNDHCTKIHNNYYSHTPIRIIIILGINVIVSYPFFHFIVCIIVLLWYLHTLNSLSKDLVVPGFYKFEKRYIVKVVL